MQQGGQGSEGRHPSSPRGGSSAASNSSMSKFSLLGQQLTNFGSAQQQQQQQQQHHPNHQHPSNSNSANMNFSLGVPSHGQPFSQGHQQQAPQSQPNGNNGGGDGAGFSNMQNVNSMVGGGQNFNQSHPFFNQQMLQQTSGGVPDFLKINQQQAPQPVQSAPALGVTGSGGVSPESLMTALATIQQKILQLQAMVPYMAQNQQLPNVAFQQQAASAISQIAQVAANMFPAPQSQQQQNIPCAPQSPITDPQQQQLSQLFGPSVPPAFNFFQPSVAAPLNNTAGGNSGLGNNFVPLQGGGSGISVDMGPSASSLASQIVAIDGGVSGNSSSGTGTGLGNGPKSTPSVGGQNFGGGQGGPSNVSSTATNMNSGLVGRNKHGSPRSNQMGTGLNRGGAAAGIAGDMSHMSNNRSAMNSGGMTTSPVDDHDVGGTGSRDEDDDGDAENLVPGSYDLVEMEAIEILAEHTHFCEICGKGFKRDANLRMHMRGHGDEYKTPAALARPDRAAHEMTVVRPRRFSCPNVGCKRNKKHRKFQPLKTMLCVKNHYRRSHCPKTFTCNKCKTKKFSVVADLKTHEKHCGCDKWQCSCGTTFSRKDKLLGHIGLFQGHTPATPFNDVDSSGGMDVSDMGGGPGNPSTMPNSGNNSSGYGLSSGGNLNSGSASSMGLGGGSGMGLAGNGLQGMSSQGGTPGGGSMNMPKDGNVLGPENSSSSDSFPSAGNLLPGSAMLQSLFTANFLQSTSGGNSSSDGLH